MSRLDLARIVNRDAARALIGERVPELIATISNETVLYDADTGAPVLVYLPVGDTADLRWAVRTARTGAGVYRAEKGYRSKSATFGNAPRRPIVQREGCRETAISRDRVHVRDVLSRWAHQLQGTLEAVLPDEVAAGVERSSAILPEWRLNEQTLWTSGVINETVQMPYHTDTANFDVWSAMPVVRRGVSGGFLHFPEYGAVVECRDSWAVWFPGYRYVHGVTPIVKRHPDGYRYSTVYYALRGMKDCGTVAQESGRARAKRTERERAAARELAKRSVQ